MEDSQKTKVIMVPANPDARPIWYFYVASSQEGTDGAAITAQYSPSPAAGHIGARLLSLCKSAAAEDKGFHIERGIVHADPIVVRRTS